MIRKATIYDIFDIADMWVEMQKAMDLPLRSYDDAEKEKFIYGLTKKIYGEYWIILVAIHEQKCVGFCMTNAHYFEYTTPNLIATCEHVYVKENCRDTGMAHSLIEESKRLSKELGCTEAEFITKYDTDLIGKWERKGYTPSQVIFVKEL